MKFLKSLVGTAAIVLATRCVSAQTPGTTNATNTGAMTGVGATTPTNSPALTTNNTAVVTNNVAVTNTTTTVGNVAVGTPSSTSSGSGIMQRIRNLLAARTHGGTGNTGNNSSLAERLRAAGSVRSGNNSAKANVATTSDMNLQNGSNTTQTVAFDLTFFEQSTNRTGTNDIVAKNSITDSDLITALGDATSNQFSASARFILTGDNLASNELQTIAIRDGSNTVDVSKFFMVSNSDVQVSGKASLGQFQNGTGLIGLENALRTGQSGTTYSILYVAFDSNGITNSIGNTNSPAAGLRFSVNGFNATTHVGNTDEVNASVSGTGMDTNGEPAVIQGTITVTGRNSSP